ncbi:MAG TPA: signal peptide peptidase SppA [Nitrospiria bacterium]|nr:signal peptide peptidase SppA [Nitrospiria bacterium]
MDNRNFVGAYGRTPLRYLGFASLVILLSGCIFNIQLLPKVEPLEEKDVSGAGADKIVLMDLSGMISEEEKGSSLVPEPNLVAQFKEELKKAAHDPAVKAVVLRINSPGGTVTASDILHHELEVFKKQTGKKVIVSIMDLGASGGYYVAVAADKIVAHPTTVTGSIGVIMLSVNVQGLLEKIGVTGTAIKSGDKKDMGSPLRPMTEEERQLFQGIINQMYDRFVSVVAAGRKNMTVDQVRKAADGRVYTAQQALDLGLVDGIGYLDDAIQSAKTEAGLSKARVVIYLRPGSYKDNIYSQMPSGAAQTVNLVNLDLRSFVQSGTPRFMYLWSPQ